MKKYYITGQQVRLLVSTKMYPMDTLWTILEIHRDKGLVGIQSPDKATYMCLPGHLIEPII